MNSTIRKEILFNQPCEDVWQAITDRDMLAEWMFPNDFEPRVGHQFTFQVPGNERFDGLTVHCQVLECNRPEKLSFSWSAGGAVVDTTVVFTLEAIKNGTKLIVEHSGFNLTLPFGEHAFKGAEFGWAKMLGQLKKLIEKK